MNNFKFYSGISEENVRKAINELTSQGFETGKHKYLEMNDTFIIYYKEKNKTIPPQSDLMKDVHADAHPFNNPYPMIEHRNHLMDLAKEYWYVVIAVIGLAGSYLMFK